ncbi:MAG: hypothetical protein AAF907_15675 [Planctomycetota bacterium]
MTVLKRIGGLVAMLAGAALLGWVGWAMYQGEENRRPGKQIAFGIGLIVVGAGWTFGLVGGDDSGGDGGSDGSDGGGDGE